MPIEVRELHDKAQTGEEMYRLVREFSDDINCFETPSGQRLSDIPLPAYFDIVKSVPFRKDPNGIEIVTRPYHMFTSPLKGWDCKKKSIAIAAWLAQNQIPFRFKSTSRRPDGQIHHCMVEASYRGEWLPIDATYPENTLYQEDRWTNEEILPSPGPGLMGDNKLVSMYGTGIACPEMAEEFNRALVQSRPECMGEPATIIAAIIGAVATVAGIIIGVVSNKRQAERSAEHDIEMARMQQQMIYDQRRAEQQPAAESGSILGPGIPEWLLPAAAAGGLLLLL